MADSGSDSSEDEGFVLYANRPEWQDIVPVLQDDGSKPVVRIAYTDKFKDVYDYFRAIIRKDEKSERALLLTHEAARLNPANYTVWHYRRSLLKELKKDLRDELQYISKVIKKYPKNYQVWFHRQQVVSWLNDPSLELPFTADMLQDDAKNYHAWQHRQWAMQTYGLWSNELAYTDQLISNDVRNNSAWNQRYFVVANTTGFDSETVAREIEYATSMIRKAYQNESSWSYLRGVMSDTGFLKHACVLDFLEGLYAEGIRSSHLLAALVDVFRERLEVASGADGDSLTLERAVQLCDKLAKDVDTIRAEYWNYEAQSLQTKYGR